MKSRLLSLVSALIILLVLFYPTHAQAPISGTVNSTANLRNGPGTTYPVVGSLAAGTAIEITGCNDDCSWYQVGPNGWVSASLVTASATGPAASAPAAAPITIVGWNVESGGALQNVVADRLANFQDVDIWGLSEVNAIDAEAFEFGAEEGEGANYGSYLGTTGRADRLLLIWDDDRFDLVNSGQLTEIGQNARSPLWVQLKETATGLEFMVMVNHLHRSNDNTRHRQAQMLNAWAASQTLPIIAIGDYNFDWNLPNGDTDHDLGYDNMTKDGVWEWIRPAELVTTQCSGWPCGYNSVLDFVFASGPARDWNIASQIIVAENDFPDDFTTPDHRPVMAAIMPAGTSPVASANNEAVLIPTATPAVQATCSQANSNANLRAGPGTGYAVVGSVTQGQCLTITGRTEVGDWFQLSNGNWIAEFLVDNAPPIASIPVGAVAVAAPSAPVATGNCDPSYPTICIPPGSPDINCPAVPYGNFIVLPPDPHNFDGDLDGFGCENNSGPSSANIAAPVQPTAIPVQPTPLPVQVQPTAVPPTAMPLPATATPVPQPAAPSCDPNYAGACIPVVSYDLDCGEISARRFQSIGSDPHGFDGDGDGLACER